jgi:hypothetical protein
VKNNLSNKLSLLCGRDALASTAVGNAGNAGMADWAWQFVTRQEDLRDFEL